MESNVGGFLFTLAAYGRFCKEMDILREQAHKV
jgi:hypothetical protein